MYQIALVVFLLFMSLFQGKTQTEKWQELLNRRQYAEIIAFAGNLSPADSADLGKMYTLALAYEGMLKYPEALKCLRHCFEMDTTAVELLNALARTETNLGRTGVAERYYKQALATDGTNFYANYQLARLYFQMEAIPKALEKYEFLLNQDPDNPILLSVIGDCYTRTGELPSAAFYYFKAYSANRENAVPANALINTLLRIGGESASTALEICDTALFYNPNNLQLKRSKAMTLFVNKKFAEADTLYSSLLMEGDSLPTTVAYGGFSRYYAGQFMKAVELLEWAYRRDSSLVDVCLFLGSALGKTYDRNRAYTLLNQAEKSMQPDSSKMRMLRLFRAETLRADQRYDEAAAYYYAIWTETKRMDVLKGMSDLYLVSSIEAYKNDNHRQRGLFCLVLYIGERLKSDPKQEELTFERRLLTSFLEDAFFRNETELPMIAPDGKRSWLSVDILRSLIARIAEVH
jgi:tetratricopeptide (TPR) repeat protein